jgi:L-amino acid N-acyltransferase YncA
MIGSDWLDVAKIYQEGIDAGNATFESKPPASWEDWRKGKINSCSLVARDHDAIVGWAALSPFSSRAVYAGVAGVSIYISSHARSKGVGSLLLQELIRVSEANGIWTLQARIFPENQPSLQLHFKRGFRQVGIQEKLGYMEFGPFAGKWRDVVFIERRSQVVGV